ncbi:MAG: hypothetical protein KAI14_05170, partial [Dehalococcoidales bacterium]|nr:hypothetical protein [Dehalococcoidales bacterium]
MVSRQPREFAPFAAPKCSASVRARADIGSPDAKGPGRFLKWSARPLSFVMIAGNRQLAIN